MSAATVVRDARPEDYAAIRRIHASSGMDYALPDLDSPLFFVKKVAERDGEVVAACCLMLQAETYLFCEGDPRTKMEAMRELQPAILTAAWARGLNQLVSWIPTFMEKKFLKRLRGLGWERGREGWHPWSRQTECAQLEDIEEA